MLIEGSMTEFAKLPEAIDIEDNIEGEDDPICYHIMGILHKR